MTIQLFVKVSLSNVSSGFPPPSCQVAIDANNDGHASGGEYVNLEQSDTTWTGEYNFMGPDPIDKRVMVGLMGCRGARWKVEVWRDSPDDDGLKLVHGTGTASSDPTGFILWMEDVS